ncbi:MAG: c-type cytochrome [Chitinophagales bacterium]|nr:c-type cytochrome [Chitinophagales bacterium]
MNKIIIFIGIVALVASCAALSSAQKQDSEDTFHAQNLKVLPADISKDELDVLMKSFSKSLGVKCSHCHAPKESGEGLDFASDSKVEKLIARGMIKMTKDINENYFSKYPKDGMITQINCMTCHNGQVQPVATQVKSED